MWRAIYAPIDSKKDPSKDGFLIEKEAEDFVIFMFCLSC